MKDKSKEKLEEFQGQNMQRFDIQLAKQIRDDYSSHKKESLVDIVRDMYLCMKEFERMMNVGHRLTAKQLLEMLRKQ